MELGLPAGSIWTELGMEGERQNATVSKVLDDDNLLIEILLRVGLPTTLVRAALVCKRWLWHVSDKAFLRRFRKLHPPRLLGFYIDNRAGLNVHFVPMLPQPPELAAVISRACFCLDSWQYAWTDIMDCRNSRVFIRFDDGPEFKLGVHSPLCAERGTATVPSLPRYQLHDGSFHIWHDVLSKEEGDDLSYFTVSIVSCKEMTNFTAHVSMLQDGVWCTHHTLAIDQPSPLLWEPKPVLVDNKIYVADAKGNIIVLDLTVSSCSKIRLPEGVEYGNRDTMFSPADDTSGIYLIQAKEFQLRIWLQKWDNWLLMDTICLCEMCGNLRTSDCTTVAGHTDDLRVLHVGDNAEFVFFQMGKCMLYMDIKCRVLRKVYEMTKKDHYSAFCFYPFKMIWPPIFPALKIDPSRNAIKEELGYHGA